MFNKQYIAGQIYYENIQKRIDNYIQNYNKNHNNVFG